MYQALLGRAWASPTLVWLHCTRADIPVCLLGSYLDRPLIVSHFWFLVFMHPTWINSKTTREWRPEPSTVYLLDGNNKDRDHSWTFYSVARAIEVTTWQTVDAVYLCCLTHGSCVEVTGFQSLLTCKSRWLECWHLFMPSPPATCAGPTCVQYALYIVARPDSEFVYMCVHFCDILWLEVQSHSDDMQTYAFKCSMFCTCTWSGSPHNVVHSSSYKEGSCPSLAARTCSKTDGYNWYQVL